MKNQINREQWLTEVVKLAEDAFRFADLELPKSWRVSCGFPSRNATGASKRRIGECHYEMNSADGTREMFVSPMLGETKQAIKTLLHEVVHCCLGPGKGHRKEFSQACKRLGFEGKPTVAEPSDAVWQPFFDRVVETLGEYPHSMLNAVNQKKQSTRMIKVVCLDCGCNLRMTRKWIEEAGLPSCGCGGEMELG